MGASTFPPPPPPPPRFEPDTEAIKRRLLKRGVHPTPKIVRTLRKKEIQKHNRKVNKVAQAQDPPPPTPAQAQELAEEAHFQAIRREYREFTKAMEARKGREEGGGLLVGKPWERIEKVRVLEAASEKKDFFRGGKLDRGYLKELKEVFQGNLKWVLEDDIEAGDDESGQELWDPSKRRQNEKEAIRFLVAKLSRRDITVRDWKLTKVMKLSGLRFGEGQLMKIVEGLGNRHKWEQAMAVVEWAYSGKEPRESKSRFVYTQLLSVLGNTRRPWEALSIFNMMREDCNTYPDMAAYHSIAVTLGQAGLIKELLETIECMKHRPSKRLHNMRDQNWDPVLEPDLVIYNAVLNACVPSRQWKHVSWVFKQLKQNGLEPNGATYGLAMEVMLESRKYDLVYDYLTKMRQSGVIPNALTYRVLVKAFWEEGKIDDAVQAVRDMEKRGVVGVASVYYELACCLCNKGRWRDAMLEVEKMRRVRCTKPLEFTFTGMISYAFEGGHVEDCISIFDSMREYCAPNIGTINTMLRVCSRNGLFVQAKELFEGTDSGGTSRTADEYTYSAMLVASARALQWDYFEYVYKQMVLAGYQLDQNKHASLLVEASANGKGLLLEHAFDTILEAGEIPHPSFFTEMVLQATARQDYHRAVALINSLACAPFQLSEQQWTSLFETNKDRLGWDCLEKLLKALGYCDFSHELTVSNLSKSLQSFCRSSSSRSSSNSVASGLDDVTSIAEGGEISRCSQEDAHALTASSVNGNPDLDDDLVSNVDHRF